MYLHEQQPFLQPMTCVFCVVFVGIYSIFTERHAMSEPAGQVSDTDSEGQVSTDSEGQVSTDSEGRVSTDSEGQRSTDSKALTIRL